MFIIFTKEKKSKEVFSVNLSKEEVDLVMQGDLFKGHKELNPLDYVVIEKEYPFNNPTYDISLDTIREMTREERILDGEEELLQDGECLVNNKIFTIPIPANLLLPIWDKELHTWKEGKTKEELIKERTEKILKYTELMNNKKILETSIFSSVDEVELIKEQISKLEKDINFLAEKIKEIGG